MFWPVIICAVILSGMVICAVLKLLCGNTKPELKAKQELCDAIDEWLEAMGRMQKEYESKNPDS